MKRVARSHLLLFAIVASVFAWSGWQPYDRFTWYLEVFPGVVGLIILATASTAFLGTQGDVCDTQEDMFMALIGATCALLFFSRIQDRTMTRLTSPS